MGRFSERARGVTVQVLDLEDMKDQAVQFRKETEPECVNASVYGGEWAVAQTKSGDLMVLCTEGVAYFVTDDDPMEFEFHGQYKDEEDSSVTRFDMFPFASTTLTAEELVLYPTKEEVDLADFVRRFGDRLENNFWTLFKELS